MIINFTKGWNFTSFPSNNLEILVQNNNIIEIKSLSVSWNRNVPEIFNTLTNIVPNKGYLVFVEKNTSITIPDVSIYNISYNIKLGWNLIGWQNNTNIEEINLENILEIKSTTQSYNSTVPTIFNSLKTLEKGKAYWLKSDKDYIWDINFSNLEILSDFDDNLREFKITVISRGANNNAMIELNSDIDLNEMIIKLKDNDITIENNMIVLPNMEDGNSIKFILKAYKLEPKEYKLNDYQLIVPELPIINLTDSNYFTNSNLPKLLLFNFMGSDNNLEPYCYNTMVEQAKLVQKNKDKYEITIISLVDRSSYNDYNDDTRIWNDSNYFNDPINDKAFDIYICHTQTNHKWSKFRIGDVEEVLNIMKTKHDSATTKIEVLDLFLILILGNLKNEEKNNPNIALSLNMWDHGVFYGISVDHATKDKYLYMNEIHDTIKTNLDRHNIQKLDYLQFECCLTTSIFNIKLFSDIALYFIGATTTQPGNGFLYDFILNGNIKNEYLNKLFDETIASYKIYYDTTSVYDMRKFIYFEDKFRKSIETTPGIVNLRTDFNKIKYIDINYKDMKSLYQFIEENDININELKEDYHNMIIKSSKEKNAVGMISKKYSDGILLDRADNVQYLYNFFKEQPGKPTINLSFTRIENNIYIKLNIVGKMKDNIELRFSNGFSFIKDFEIIESSDKADINETRYRRSLIIYPTTNSIVNLSIKSPSLIEMIYFDGKKYYIEDSIYKTLLDIEGENYFIESLSKNMELIKLNVSNITGNEEKFIGNINFSEIDGNINITGYSFAEDNISIAFGSVIDNFIYRKFDIINGKQINGFFNIDLDFKVLRIGLYDYFIKDYFEDDNIIKVTTVVLYQDKIKEKPIDGSILVNLELIREKKTNQIIKRFWDVYGFNKTISEIIPSESSSIYNIFIKPVSNDNFRRLSINSIIYLDGKYYNWGLQKISETEYIRVPTKEISDFTIIEDEYFTNITLYFISKNNFLSKNINRSEINLTKVNSQNLIDEINKSDYVNNNKLYDDEFYNNEWNDLNNEIKDNLIILGFNENFWNLRKNDVNYNLQNISEIFTTWDFISPQIKKAAINLGYNSNSWNLKDSKFKRTLFIESDILLVNQNIMLQDILLVISSNNYFVIGENCNFNNMSVILNYGTLVIQDNGYLENNNMIINSKSARIVITSGNKDKVPTLINSRLLNNNGSIYISGHALFYNNYLLRNESLIKIGSLNSFKPNKSYAKLINNVFILPYNQTGTTYANKFFSNNIIQLENGGQLLNTYIGVIMIYKIYVIDNNKYTSSVIDTTKKVLSPNIPSNWEIELFINDISNQLPNYENNNIYLGTNINLKKIGTYIDKPNIVLNITEIGNLLEFSIKNNSNNSSLGANNKDYFVLGFQTNDENVVNKLEYILRTKNVVLDTVILEEKDSKYSLSIEKEFCTITPALRANDEFKFFIDKRKFIESAGFENKNIKASLLVDYGNYVGETNEDDNIVSYVFNEK